MTTRPVVLIAQPHLAPLAGLLADAYEALPLWEDSGRARMADAQAIVAAGEFPLANDLLDAMPRLGLVAFFTVGYEGIDPAYARARGLRVTHAANANDEDVADHAIGLMIAHRRAIAQGDRALREGRWVLEAKTMTRSLGENVLGIVGLGSIGAAVARRAEAMRMTVRWWGPSPKPDAPWPRADSLVALAEQSDVLVIAARADAANRGLISAQVIHALGSQGLLVNVARGQLVDEDALIAALHAGTLGGAALDVFAQEPTPASRWESVPNTLLTPHTGGATDAAVARMAQMLRANLAAFFAGSALPNPVG